MKSIHSTKLTAVLILCSLASAVVARPARENQERQERRAQSPNQNRPPNEGPRGERSFGPPQGGMPFARVLNDEQREQLREAMQANREKMREMGERQQKLRAEMEEVIFADKLDEDAVRKRAAELAEMDAQRQIFQARAFQKVRPSLSPEQLTQIKKMREEMGRAREQRREQFFDQRREQFQPRGGESIGPKPETGPDRPRDGERPNRPKPEARSRDEFRPERQFARSEAARREGMSPERRFDSPRQEPRGDFGPRPQGQGRSPGPGNREQNFNQPNPPGPQGFRRDSASPRPGSQRRDQSQRMDDRPQNRGDIPPPPAPGRP